MKQFEYVGNPTNKIIKDDKVYLNDEYQVNLKELRNGWTWLSIKRLDKDSIHDWRAFQQIKNMICGEEREAVEVYPAESRLVDTSNQYHLFVLPKGRKFPLGFNDRIVVDGTGEIDKESNTRQRPFKDDERPKDCLTLKEMNKLVKPYMTHLKLNNEQEEK